MRFDKNRGINMKKLAIMLLITFGVVGCSCNKDIYKFDSVIVEGKTYTCSKKDKEDAQVKLMCENFSEMSIELKDKDTMVVNFPAYEIKNEKEDYKIENGYLYMKDDGEWMKFAEYSKDKLTLEMTGVKVILKK